MKTINLLGAVATGVVMLSACSNEAELPENGGNLANGKQEIVLQVSNTGSGLTTRGRVLYSQEAKQSIDHVRLIIVSKDNGIMVNEEIKNWGDSKEYDDNGTHGKFVTINIEDYYKVNGTGAKLPAGDYSVYAIGYTENDYDLSGLVKDNQFVENAQLTVSTGNPAEEIFAGSQALNIKDGQNFKAGVVLNRQVAGAFGYFKNVPYEEGATTLRLVTKSKLNTKLVLGNFYNNTIEGYKSDDNEQIPGNGLAGTNAQYVVNGTEASTSEVDVIYSIDLAAWYGEIKNNNGVIDMSGWRKPEAYASQSVDFEEGSVFAGNFVIPFAKTPRERTFELQLCKADGTALKTWNVKLPTEELSQNVFHFNGNAWTQLEGAEDETSYSIVRNHLYALGTRTKDKPENPGPGPGPDPDDPEDLVKNQTLTLKVCDNWEVIHKMGLEEDKD